MTPERELLARAAHLRLSVGHGLDVRSPGGLRQDKAILADT